MTAQQLTTATEEQSTYSRCACHAFEIQTWSAEVPEGADPGDYAQYEGTGCTQLTHRTFAPGHDAKLKSLLIRAGAAGAEVVRHEGGVTVVTSAERVAEHFGFWHQVLAGIRRSQAKAAEKTARKTAKPAARAPRTQKQQQAEASPIVVLTPARIKVGRWEYDAKINTSNNSAQYTSASGESKTAPEGKYTVVSAK